LLDPTDKGVIPVFNLENKYRCFKDNAFKKGTILMRRHCLLYPAKDKSTVFTPELWCLSCAQDYVTFCIGTAVCSSSAPDYATFCTGTAVHHGHHLSLKREFRVRGERSSITNTPT
jgi:hypothetical protein